jgi:hypothetical protein
VIDAQKLASQLQSQLQKIRSDEPGVTEQEAVTGITTGLSTLESKLASRTSPAAAEARTQIKQLQHDISTRVPQPDVGLLTRAPVWAAAAGDQMSQLEETLRALRREATAGATTN